MHEMAIAEMLMAQVQAVAAHDHAVKVEQVDVELGQLRQVVPEALELAFAVVSQSTVAGGAKLVLTEKNIVAHCRDCDLDFPAELGVLQCPQCKLTNVNIVDGDDIILRSVVCRQEQPEGQDQTEGE